MTTNIGAYSVESLRTQTLSSKEDGGGVIYFSKTSSNISVTSESFSIPNLRASRISATDKVIIDAPNGMDIKKIDTGDSTFTIKTNTEMFVLAPLVKFNGNVELQNLTASRISATDKVTIDAPNGVNIPKIDTGNGSFTIKTNTEMLVEAPLVKFNGNVKLQTLSADTEMNVNAPLVKFNGNVKLQTLSTDTEMNVNAPLVKFNGNVALLNITASRISALNALNGVDIPKIDTGDGSFTIKTNTEMLVNAPLVKFDGIVKLQTLKADTEMIVDAPLVKFNGDVQLQNLATSRISATDKVTIDAPNGVDIQKIDAGDSTFTIKTNTEMIVDAPLVKFNGDVQFQNLAVTKVLRLAHENDFPGVQIRATGAGFFDLASGDASVLEVVTALNTSKGVFYLSHITDVTRTRVYLKDELRAIRFQELITSNERTVRVYLDTVDHLRPDTTAMFSMVSVQDALFDGAGIVIDHKFNNLPGGVVESDYRQSIEWQSKQGMFKSDGSLVDVTKRPRWEVSGGNLMVRSVNNVGYMFGVADNGDFNLYKVVKDANGVETSVEVGKFYTV